MKLGYKIVLLILALLNTLSCTVPLNKIANNGSSFDGKKVTVKGKVINTLHLDDLNFFVLKKGSDKVNVITNDFLPVVNDNVKVKGKVISKFYYQRDTILVIKEMTKPSGKEMNFNKVVN
ncbi:MAG: hypothetical protein IIU11_02305 [Bacteroidales bacterium]|jgi:hypothetical protein|nr:hypothetical protein [Bacteroidales bacterium]MBR6278592.1 hypothetical protein [Bacteroidales bacterium]